MNYYNDWTIKELFDYKKYIIEKCEYYQVETRRHWSETNKLCSSKLYNLYINHLNKINDEIENFKKIPGLSISKDLVDNIIWKYLN